MSIMVRSKDYVVILSLQRQLLANLAGLRAGSGNIDVSLPVTSMTHSLPSIRDQLVAAVAGKHNTTASSTSEL